MASDEMKWVRVLNRLDAAINHHQNAKGFAEDRDLALWAARDRIMADAALPGDELVQVGDLLQSEGSRLADYVAEEDFDFLPYEVRMAAVSIRTAVERWTAVRAGLTAGCEHVWHPMKPASVPGEVCHVCWAIRAVEDGS